MVWMPWMRTSWRRAGFTPKSPQGCRSPTFASHSAIRTPSFDFVLCNAVIQHIEPAIALGTTLPEFARIVRPGGVLQLMFKYGSGVATVYDRDYGAERTFQLYDVDEVLGILHGRDLRVIPAEGGELGGVMYFKDPKPMDHCVFFARKDG